MLGLIMTTGEKIKRTNNNINSIKLKIPSFNRRNDDEAYLEWEIKVELVFDYHNYSEENKIKLITVRFTNYALVWWDQLLLNRKQNGECPMSSWRKIKFTMRKKFIPSYYYKEMHQKLQHLIQGFMSMEDYSKEMEIALIRANVEVTIASFLSGLNQKIANIVELQHYVELKDMVYMAMKVGKQLKHKGVVREFSNPLPNHDMRWSSKDEKFKSQKPQLRKVDKGNSKPPTRTKK